MKWQSNNATGKWKKLQTQEIILTWNQAAMNMTFHYSPHDFKTIFSQEFEIVCIELQGQKIFLGPNSK